MSMAIENGTYRSGPAWWRNYKKSPLRLHRRGGRGGGQTPFVLEDGKRFKSPSAAGSAVMGGTACNGWRFWSVEGEETKPAASKRPAAARKTAGKNASAPKARKPKATKLIYRDARPDGSHGGL